MDSINKVILLGAVCRLPRTTQTKTGKDIVSFGLVTQDSTQGENGAVYKDYHNITAMGEYAARSAASLEMGQVVYIEGKTKSGKYTDKQGVEHKTADIMAFVVKDFPTLVSCSDNGENSSGYQGRNQQSAPRPQYDRQPAPSRQPAPPPRREDDDDSGLPF